MKKLVFSTLSMLFFGVLILGLLLFLPAGTLAYWQAWAFIAVFLLSTNGIGVYLSLKDPALLERRKAVGPGAEQSTAQKVIMSLAFLVIIGLLIFCALDRRFGWSFVPGWVSILGDGLVALGLMINLIVFRENSFGASNIRTEEGQQVITTGPYALIRHPMYAGVLVMMAGVPLALGSWWGLLVLLVQIPVLVWRILDEEALLIKELAGYPDYMRKVRYRLLPGVW